MIGIILIEILLSDVYILLNIVLFFFFRLYSTFDLPLQIGSNTSQVSYKNIKFKLQHLLELWKFD